MIMQRFRKNIVAHISAKDNIETSLRKQSFDGNHHLRFLYKNMDVAKKQHLQTHDNDQSTDV